MWNVIRKYREARDAEFGLEKDKILFLLVGAGLIGVPLARGFYKIMATYLVPRFQEHDILNIWWIVSYLYFLGLFVVLLTVATSISAGRVLISFDLNLAFAALITTAAMVAMDPACDACLARMGLGKAGYVLGGASLWLVLKTVVERASKIALIAERPNPH